MNTRTRTALLLCAALGLASAPSIPRTLAQSSTHEVMLSAADRQISLHASRLGGTKPALARAWLLRQALVSSATFGRDHQTLQVAFRDGASVVLVPRQKHRTALLSAPTFGSRRAMRDTGSARAIVLEPFADELGLGDTAGAGEVTALQSAGFATDMLRNGAVTVAAMETLANYAVVYMETHSGTLGDGDAIVLTRQTDSSSIKNLFTDGSVTQGLAYGDQNLYIAIKAQFVSKHVGTFPNSSIIFLNGCEVLDANVLWDALRQHNVATLIGWDNKVVNTLDEQAADFMFPRLAGGETIASNVAAAKDAHLGVSTFDNTDAHLGFLGEGNNTFSNALHGTALATATPTVTVTSAATPTAVPTDTPTPVVHKVRPCKRKSYHRVHGKCVPKKKAKPAHAASVMRPVSLPALSLR